MDVFVSVFPGKLIGEASPKYHHFVDWGPNKREKDETYLNYSIHFPYFLAHYAVNCLTLPWHLSMDGSLINSSSLKFFLINILVIEMRPNSVFYSIFKTNENMLPNIFFSSLFFNIKIVREKTDKRKDRE